MKGLHDACDFLLTICDDDVAKKVRLQVGEVDERWQEVQRVLADKSVHQYEAAVLHVNDWCDVVETELSRHIGAAYDDLSVHNNLIEVSLCFFLAV